MIGGSQAAGTYDDVLVRLLGQLGDPGASKRDLLDRIGLLERLKSACAAAQVRVTAQLRAQERERLTPLGVPESDQLRSLGAEVGLARQESPVAGRRRLKLASVLVADMPHTLEALESGSISEWCADEVTTETVLLSSDLRRELDAEVGGSLTGLSVGRAKLRARRVAQRLDPDIATLACDAAAGKRQVTIRPADHGMTYLTALLPLAAGVAAYAALHHAAAAAKAAGDERGRGQLMADLLAHRLITSATTASAVGEQAAEGVADTATRLPGGVGVEIQLIMTDATLLDGDDEPALLNGQPIPAPLARRLALATAGRKVRLWVRRLFTAPGSDQLITCDQTRRLFPDTVRTFLLARDQVCRTPWCGAPIRHADHINGYADGGLTSLDNAQGLCENCNHTKELDGWRHLPRSDGAVEILTPSGHRYLSHPPPPPRAESRDRDGELRRAPGS